MLRDDSPPAPETAYVPLVAVLRGGQVESLHHGAIAVVDASGAAVASCGDPETRVFLRSAAKPAQVLPLLREGGAERFGLDAAALAVMIGSHNGEAIHLEAVRRVLRAIGLDEGALQCGVHAPFHRGTARALRERGLEPGVLHNNCSGKHAGMLALAVHLGSDVASYLDAGHPVQRRIREAIESLCGLGPGAARAAVDGCSAPTFAVPLRAAALLYARLVEPDRAPPPLAAAARSAVAAMRLHPDLIAGEDRICTVLMRLGSAGLIAKIGAEGIFGLAFERDGHGMGIALKIADGNGERARYMAILEVLRQLGVLDAATTDRLAARFVEAIRSHRGMVVGEVRPVFALRRPDPRPRPGRAPEAGGAG
ncbi:MAG: asparaginase [Candidatus Polarisedimenticolia bacterium]